MGIVNCDLQCMRDFVLSSQNAEPISSFPQRDSPIADKRLEFEAKRKMHYNEGAILKQHLDVDEDEDDEGDTPMK